VVFLLSDRAGYVVGTHVVVDGGRSTCVSAGTIGVSATPAPQGVSA
jgi:gluconate 5-dehydrogenase